MKKSVITYEKELTSDSQFGNIVLSLSKYADCLLVFINQTGALGSIVTHSSHRSKECLVNPPPSWQKRRCSKLKHLVRLTSYTKSECCSDRPTLSSTICCYGE
jgi:hypothetical protein